MPRFATTRLEVKVDNSIVNKLWSRFVLNQFSRETRQTCPLLRPREDICIGFYVLSRLFKRAAHLAKKCVSAATFRTIRGKQRRIKRKVFGISEAEPLRFD